MPGTAQRILVVDDEPLVRESVEMLLTHFGYETECASGGEQALSCLEQHHFDAVLTDHSMPGMKGDQLAKAIKQQDQRLPVIMLSATPPGPTVEGVDLVLLKPFDLGNLRTALAKLLPVPEACCQDA